MNIWKYLKHCLGACHLFKIDDIGTWTRVDGWVGKESEMLTYMNVTCVNCGKKKLMHFADVVNLLTYPEGYFKEEDRGNKMKQCKCGNLLDSPLCHECNRMYNVKDFNELQDIKMEEGENIP